MTLKIANQLRLLLALGQHNERLENTVVTKAGMVLELVLSSTLTDSVLLLEYELYQPLQDPSVVERRVLAEAALLLYESHRDNPARGEVVINYTYHLQGPSSQELGVTYRIEDTELAAKEISTIVGDFLLNATITKTLPANWVLTPLV